MGDFLTIISDLLETVYFITINILKVNKIIFFRKIFYFYCTQNDCNWLFLWIV